MTDRETTRLVAWSKELRDVHRRLREALHLAQAAVRIGESSRDATGDLLLYCHGFCAALDGHHRGEDRALFPAIEAAHPELAPVLRALEQDHSMIAHLLSELRNAVDHSASPAELAMHLDGVAAVMETHFAYEERQLLTVLKSLELNAPVGDVLGPL
ncbi:hemerythrin domain-containing protein [Rathayibacter sp. VKM Ac-2926]|uniref:hemerythrin domain-containing protein n=1 Tax=Rathayibacter sp. VKM Ac-2926 TaxID=2929477 RepID=UPI001FB28833|nr:hemerythrin domain-containing protein [Rathayibacter sp. VKM Ac-2926]MCJ1703470.1 hemerythrin domain-containing protein [Rathayibacter sp. VKM Ac-2926]